MNKKYSMTLQQRRDLCIALDLSPLSDPWTFSWPVTSDVWPLPSRNYDLFTFDTHLICIFFFYHFLNYAWHDSDDLWITWSDLIIGDFDYSPIHLILDQLELSCLLLARVTSSWPLLTPNPSEVDGLRVLVGDASPEVPDEAHDGPQTHDLKKGRWREVSVKCQKNM